VYPGGFGTVDELLELLVAFHTNQASRKPMVLIDQPFWSGLLEWFDSELAARKLIDSDKTDFIQVVDDELAALGVLLGADVAAELTDRFAG
jgi:predicted Rossmann-fold nucleotide-binding protein